MAPYIPSFDQIMQRGQIRIRLKRSGMFQIIPFRVTFEQLPIGRVPYLTTDKIIDMPELERICNEYKFPIIAKNGRAFPTGKSAHDFVIKEKEVQASASQPPTSALGQTAAGAPAQNQGNKKI